MCHTTLHPYALASVHRKSLILKQCGRFHSVLALLPSHVIGAILTLRTRIVSHHNPSSKAYGSLLTEPAMRTSGVVLPHFAAGMYSTPLEELRTYMIHIPSDSRRTWTSLLCPRPCWKNKKSRGLLLPLLLAVDSTNERKAAAALMATIGCSPFPRHTRSQSGL